MSGTTAFALTAVGMLAVNLGMAVPASAAVSPLMDRPANAVTAAPLPTVQVDGIVWSQGMAGNTVYVGGAFNNARPAGAAVGTNQTPRQNFMSYDVTTGNLNTGFAPSVNAVVNAVAVSPDKSRVYVGGAFTSANGQVRNRLAAYSTSTGALLSTFAPNLNGTVTALTVTDTTVYAAGYFNSVNGNSRSRLAAFRATDGALTAWAPTTDNDITSIVLTPDNSKVVIGGKFATVNGQAAQGVSAVAAADGSVVAWPVNQVVKNGNAQSGTYSLSADNDTIYGSSFNYGTGNFEGIFAMNQDGTIKWLADCHGDTYASVSLNNIVYAAGHAHTCANIGGFYENNPRWEWRAMAFSKAVTGDVLPNNQPGSGYGDFRGQPSPSVINWFPEFAAGSVTGLNQAVWSMTGNSTYLATGGEFPRINGKAQQGLARFAVAPIGTSSGPTQLGGVTNPGVRALGSYAARITWRANWDRDDRNLTYKVVRADRASTPLDTRIVPSTFWDRPSLAFTDTTVVPGQTYRYRIVESDPNGVGTQSDYVSVTIPVGVEFSPYAQTVLNDGAVNYYRLDDAAGTTLADIASGNDMVKGSPVTANPTGAIVGDENASSRFSASTGTGAKTAVAGPTTFTTETWIRTTSTSGGKILGFGASSTGTSNNYDRHLYMNNTGRLTFGVYPGAVRSLTTPGSYNDGQWHHVVSQLSPAGLSLWVDGVQQGSDTNTTTAQPYNGFWRIGYDNQNGWPNVGSSASFTGDIDDTAIYPTALTPTQIRNHYTRSGRTVGGAPVNEPPTAVISQTCTGLVCAFDGSGSTDSDGTVASYAWDFGDNSTGTGAKPAHTYAAAGTYPVKLTVTDNGGVTGTVTKSVTVAAANTAPVAAFTATTADLKVSVDATDSTDPDGTVASYAWDFGDGSTGTGATTSRTYAAAGTYQVKLTVRDDDGATDTLTKSVTVTAPATTPTVAADQFNRTGTGWGSADTGGAWTLTGGATNFSTNGTAGVMKLATTGSVPAAALESVSASDVVVTTDLSVDKIPNGGGASTMLMARKSGTSYYWLKVRYMADGTVNLAEGRRVNNVESVIREVKVSGLTYTAGDRIRVKFSVTGNGTATLTGKAWRAGSTEPTANAISVTDSTAGLATASGSVGLRSYTSGTTTNVPVAVSVDSFTAVRP